MLDCIQCFVEQMLTHRADRENHMTKVSKLTQSKRSWRLILSTIYIHITACVCRDNKTAKKKKKISCVCLCGSWYSRWCWAQNGFCILLWKMICKSLNFRNWILKILCIHACNINGLECMIVNTNTCTHKYIENAYNKWTCMVWDVTLEIKIGQRRWHSLPKKKTKRHKKENISSWEIVFSLKKIKFAI